MIRLRKTLLLVLVNMLQQCARSASPEGYVIEWGWNTLTATAQPPRQILTNAVAISAGFFHRLALVSDGTVVGWGGNLFGCATGSTNEGPDTVRIGGRVLKDVVSVAADRDFSLALRQDGTIATWGQNYVPNEATNIAAIAAELGCSWALRRDGTIIGWLSQPSSPSYGQLLNPALSNVIKIAVGPGGGQGTRGLALKKDGTADKWGSETIHKDASPPADLSNVIAVAVGYNHSLALMRDSTVTGWGFNDAGQATGAPNTNSPFVSAGQVALGGQALTNIIAIAANRGYSLALRKDGTIVSWGRMVNNLYPVTIPPGLSNVVAIAAGGASCLAITTNKLVADRFLKP
jgi:hypothetical protein